MTETSSLTTPFPTRLTTPSTRSLPGGTFRHPQASATRLPRSGARGGSCGRRPRRSPWPRGRALRGAWRERVEVPLGDGAPAVLAGGAGAGDAGVYMLADEVPWYEVVLAGERVEVRRLA